MGSELIDVSTGWGTTESVAAVALASGLGLAMFVWCVFRYLRLRRLALDGERLRKQAILAERIDVGAVPVIGRVDPGRTTPIVVAGNRWHDELSFEPFEVETSDGQMLRVETPASTCQVAARRRLTIKPGAKLHLFGEVIPPAQHGDPTHAVQVLRPPPSQRFILSLERFGAGHRKQARLNQIVGIVAFALMSIFALGIAPDVERLSSGQAGEARVVRVELTKRQSGINVLTFCDVQAERPDGRATAFSVGGAFCDQPNAPGNLSPGDRIPLLFVPGSDNQQLGHAWVVDLGVGLIGSIGMVLALLAYLFVWRILTQEPRFIESMPRVT